MEGSLSIIWPRFNCQWRLVFPLHSVKERQIRKGVCIRGANDLFLIVSFRTFLLLSSRLLFNAMYRQIENKTMKKNVSCWLMTLLWGKKKSLIYRRLHSRLRFNSLSTSNKNENNLLQYREIREEKPHCVLRWKVTGWDSSGGRRYSSKDGERLEEDMEAEQGFCEPGSDYSDPSHCENAAETSSLWGWTWTFCNLWKLRNKLLTDRNQGWCLPRTGTHAL